MSLLSSDISYFARTTFRRRNQLFGIRQSDRLAHIYIIGKTGAGKSSLIETLALQDLLCGRGFALIDPHGDMVESLAAMAPPRLRERMAYLNAPDPSQPFGYNPLRRVRDDKIPLAAAGLIESLRKLWPEAWGVRMEHVLRNSLYALLERDGSTLPDILKLFSDERFRKGVVRALRNNVVKAFWISEFERYHYRQRADAVAPIQNKLGALLADPTMRRILVAPVSDLHLRNLMDRGQGLLVNLSKGQLGEDAAQILGCLLISTLGLAALSRTDIAQSERRPYFIYVDEFHTFSTLAFVNMFAELRKFGVGLTVSNQHLQQLDPNIRHSVLGNAGSIVSFRLGPEDAIAIAREMAPVFEPLDLMALPNHHIYLRLMIEGSPSRPFSAQTAQARLDPKEGAQGVNLRIV